MHTEQPIDLVTKASLLHDYWSPRVLAEVNDYQVKIARMKGEFVWHRHEHTDELFLLLEGQLDMEIRDEAGEIQRTTLWPGQLYVVGKNIEHRPVVPTEAVAIIIEPRGVVNTGDADSVLRAKNDVWL